MGLGIGQGMGLGIGLGMGLGMYLLSCAVTQPVRIMGIWDWVCTYCLVQ